MVNKRYKTKPLSARDFFTDKRYLGFAHIWPSALEDMSELFDSDRHYNRALFFEPPGAGKTLKGALALSYTLYLIANLTDPLGEFGLDRQASEIGVLNMAMSGRTAHRVLYRMLRGLIQHSKWFERYCPTNEAVTSEIRLPNPFFCWSGNSSEAFPAGYTCFAGAVDEASMFLNQSHRGVYTDQVQNIYEVMEERTESRFLDQGYVFLLAASSYSNPFLEELIKESKVSGSRILVRRRPLWLAQPRQRYSGKYRVFDTQTMKLEGGVQDGLFSDQNQKEILDQLENGIDSIPRQQPTNRVNTVQPNMNVLQRIVTV